MKTADDVAMNLKERYKDQWVDPKDDRGMPKKEETEWIGESFFEFKFK